MIKQGKYIVIEGGDGTGKSTQVDKLATLLRSQGHDVLVVEEPGGTPMADAIRLILKDKRLPRHPKTNIGLFTAARIDLWENIIAPALTSGKIIVSSRNYFSTLVYQGYGEGMDLDYIEQISQLSLPKRYYRPDIAIVLSAEERLERLEKRDQADFTAANDFFESKPDDFQARLDAGYLELAKKYRLPVVSAIGTPDEVAQRIAELIKI